jgi:hypothetical protein
MTSWTVTLESSQNVQRSTEVYLGDLAAAEGPLTLTINTSSSEFYVDSSKRLQRSEGEPGMIVTITLGEVYKTSLLLACQGSPAELVLRCKYRPASAHDAPVAGLRTMQLLVRDWQGLGSVQASLLTCHLQNYRPQKI